jgi:dTDP-4-amino-4,6-dideoxygalactose transaminase
MPLHRQQAYRDFPADPQGLAVSDTLAQTVFSLPMHPYLEPETQDRIIRTLLQA